MKTIIEITAAIIKNDKNKFLICQRPGGKNCEYLWEFPGGKQEPDETLEICLIREIKELNYYKFCPADSDIVSKL